MDVCILTAGKGTRFTPFTEFANKCLAPVPFRPLLSCLIDQIPETWRLVICVGHFGADVEAVIRRLHPDRNIVFHNVEDFETAGAGSTLLQALPLLGDSFLMLPNDGLYPSDIDIGSIETEHDLLLGAGGEQDGEYLRLVIDAEASTVAGFARGDWSIGVAASPSHRSEVFTGFMYVKDKAVYERALRTEPDVTRLEVYSAFPEYLNTGSIGFLNVDWLDIGTYASYKDFLARTTDYDFSKVDEALLLDERSRNVYKFFRDPSISHKRVIKADRFPTAFPSCELTPSGHGYRYEYRDAITMYEEPSIANLELLLDFLTTNLWNLDGSELPNHLSAEDVEQFYLRKSLERIEMIARSVDIAAITSVNGVELPQVFSADLVPFDRFFDVHPSPIHGDLQYDNVLIDAAGRITLIDWRHEFGSSVLVGDLYYDLAKLLGGMFINYSRIKLGEFGAGLKGGCLTYHYEVDDWMDEHVAFLRDFHLDHNLDFEKTKSLVSLIYLNMAPLHAAPFDLFLLSKALELSFH
jgi:dTDP-glucose pyrophosphorylase